MRASACGFVSNDTYWANIQTGKNEHVATRGGFLSFPAALQYLLDVREEASIKHRSGMYVSTRIGGGDGARA